MMGLGSISFYYKLEKKIALNNYTTSRKLGVIFFPEALQRPPVVQAPVLGSWTLSFVVCWDRMAKTSRSRNKSPTIASPCLDFSMGSYKASSKALGYLFV